MGLQEREGSRSPKRGLSRPHLVDDATQRVEVGPSVDRERIDALGRHVVRGSQHRQRSMIGSRERGRPGHPEVGDLRNPPRPIRLQQDIRRLQIPVDDPGCVCGGQTGRDPTSQLQDAHLVEGGLPGDELGQGRAVHQLHQQHPPSAQSLQAVDPHQIGMLEGSGELDLALEAGDRFGIALVPRMQALSRVDAPSGVVVDAKYRRQGASPQLLSPPQHSSAARHLPNSTRSGPWRGDPLEGRCPFAPFASPSGIDERTALEAVAAMSQPSPESRAAGAARAARAVVDEHEAGSTLAAILRQMQEGLPWSKCRDLVRSGRVQVDGEIQLDPALRLKAGALVEVDPKAKRRRSQPLPEERIVYLDHEIVVVNKPPRLVTVPYDEEDRRDSLIARTQLALHERSRERRPASPRGAKGKESERREILGIVQRLDIDTTGLLVFARTRGARKRLEAQFRAHTVIRRYLALAPGSVRPFTRESWLVPNRGDGLRGSWRGGGRPPKQARRAITHVKVEEALPDASLLSCQLETGRQHQIRIHLAEAGHPLIGETVYTRGYRGPRFEAPRPLLHAATLGFKHPSHDRPLFFEAPLPDDFVEILERLRKGEA